MLLAVIENKISDLLYCGDMRMVSYQYQRKIIYDTVEIYFYMLQEMLTETEDSEKENTTVKFETRKLFLL